MEMLEGRQACLGEKAAAAVEGIKQNRKWRETSSDKASPKRKNHEEKHAWETRRPEQPERHELGRQGGNGRGTH